MHGSLFTRDFLLEGIADTEAWKALGAAEVEIFRAAVAAAFHDFPVGGKPNEAQTEDDLIVPVLKALGWTQYLRQQPSAKRRENVPDILLFADADFKKRANAEKQQPHRYRHGVAIVESKAWQLPLDRGAPDLFNQDAPSSQILRYMTQVEDASKRAIQWGVLTNGRLWRLYYQGASSRSEEFLELDVAVLADAAGVQPELDAEEIAHREHLLKAFLLLFRRGSFAPSAEDGRTFHQIALSRTKEWEARVSQDLSQIVFERVFPQLVEAVVKGDPKAPKSLTPPYLDEVRHAALTLLYRVLFVLYAEDRNLLPAHDQGYDDYSLRKLRTEIQERIDRKVSFSATATSTWDRLKTTFNLIDDGDTSIGLPPYNGGLFDPAEHPLLARTQLNDLAIGPVLDLLSRRRSGEDEPPKRINYRDLSVQHLGSIYERLLEYVVVAKDGGTDIQLNPFARKSSGSYYTHEDLVHLIIERTIGPLVNERVDAFSRRAKALAKDTRPIGARMEELSRLDPAVAILGLKICDPAMGSGHFLVSLVDYLADKILEAMVLPVEWSDPRQPYKSPLIARIGAIRQRIRAEAGTNHWKVEESHLDDRHLVRRMILKRCVYGVDKNPVAVELAQVSLWLHTFTVGAPLSFLDHHLRCGDSLFGEWVRPVEDMLVERGGMFLNPSVAKAKNSAKGMLAVEALTDADIAEVRTSSTTFAGVEEATAPLARFMNLVHACKWIEPENEKEKSAIEGFYDGQFGDPVAIADGTEKPKGKDAAVLTDLIAKAQALVAEQRFLHWEVAFPGVWTDWESKEPTGGFDAVIGNPPWDKMEMEEEAWFEDRRREVARASTTAERQNLIAALRQTDPSLFAAFQLADKRAKDAVRVARELGAYPYLSKGRPNIYGLFVERALRLIKPDGLVGLLTPSGIVADKAAAAFFRSLASARRVGAILDFENRNPAFFDDVDGRFKFCVFLMSGPSRTFASTDCAFFLHNIADIPRRSFALSAEDFQRVNPNTGTAPVFRVKRDADIAKAVYATQPVMATHTGVGHRVFPVRLMQMINLATDSGLFRDRSWLDGNGFYRVAGNRYINKRDEFRPLYEGKLVQAFNHRASGVKLNKANVRRQAQEVPSPSQALNNPDWFPEPQFFLRLRDVPLPSALEWILTYKDITASTNSRTMIACIIPRAGAGHTLPIIIPDFPPEPTGNEAAMKEWRGAVAAMIVDYISYAPLMLATLNSLPLDYLARQKVQSTHLSWYIVEQLPVIRRNEFDKKIGKTKIADFIRGEVLRLTYTAHDMAPFAHDMDCDGPPFAWDEDDRRHRRARLDALFFRLYGIDEKDAAYILDTFPIVREQDEAAFGRYLTKDLVLAYMRAIAAGDLKSRVTA